MTAITGKGMTLAIKLHPLIGLTTHIEETCSLIARHATTHKALMEAQCNRELTEAEETKIERLEERITDLVDQLPESDFGPFVVDFQGDPRGVTVKLRIKDFTRHSSYDGWAGEGILVPQ